MREELEKIMATEAQLTQARRVVENEDYLPWADVEAAKKLLGISSTELAAEFTDLSQQAVFGVVAAGTAIKLEGYPHTYFKTKDNGCFRYAEDNNTKVHMDFVPFAWPVEIVQHT